MLRLNFLVALLLAGIIAQAQINLSLLGQVPFPGQTCAGVWHHVDSAGNEYALVGASGGIAIVDVSNPASPSVLQTVPIISSLWQEVKVWNNHLYHVTEGGGGLTIVDLNPLPATCPYKVYNGDGVIDTLLDRAHTVAATDGYLYIFGASGIANGGAIICSLADPWNPVYVGEYNANYVHDGYIRGNTLYTSEIYAGQFGIVDISTKSSPTILATQTTPSLFNHNTWLSDDSQTIFTTDEITAAPLASYDISDLSNIRLLDTYLTEITPSGEVHNTRVLNDYLVNANYAGQVTIVDANDPENLIEVARFPTNSWLCWDIDPYLPSGNILATDVDNGLFILGPTYVRAGYLEGTVTDSLTSVPLGAVLVEILTTPKTDQSSTVGAYKTGYGIAGTYSVRFSKTGYLTKTINNVQLTSGMVTTLDVQLVGTTSVSDIEGNASPEYDIFPNPSNGLINISFSDPASLKSAEVEWSLFGINGGLIDQQVFIPSQKTSLELQGIAAGTYSYMMRAGGKLIGEGKLLIE